MNGVRRTPFQVLPKSEAKITCVRHNDDNQATHEWFMRSIDSWIKLLQEQQQLPLFLEIYRRKERDDSWVSRDWDFVLVVPLNSVREFWCGNDGMTAWRRKQCGYTVPDHCRQTGGCPEVWNASDLKGKREMHISNLSVIEPFVVLDHAQVQSSVFPEARLHAVKPTF